MSGLTVVRGALVRPVRGGEAARRCDREVRGALVRATDAIPRPVDDAVYDLRRGRNRWWGSLLRWIDRVMESDPEGRHDATLEQIGHFLVAYVRERRSEMGGKAA
jgi:hypothetical protein